MEKVSISPYSYNFIIAVNLLTWKGCLLCWFSTPYLLIPAFRGTLSFTTFPNASGDNGKYKPSKEPGIGLELKMCV